MKRSVSSKSAQSSGTYEALVRAGKRARAIAEETGTPLYIMKNGKVIDINKKRKPRKLPAKSPLPFGGSFL